MSSDHFVSDDDFRAAMRRLPSPVTVVTTRAPHGGPVGSTVGATISLSLAPRLMLISVITGGTLEQTLRRFPGFTINVLDATQADVARRFGSVQADKFSGVEWEEWEGLPRIAGAVSYLRCTVRRTITVGDHTLFAGEPTAIEMNDGTLPMVYVDRTFGRVSAPVAV